ncbi:MAG: phosphatidylglycerophosphatase A [Ignavibacteria bacterium]|nr:phosphatidylglycerophosphatase A [Ignavibacteria bacterium]
MRIIKKKKIADPDARVSLPALIITSFFFTGYFPAASGTIGSLAALVICFLPALLQPVNLSLLILAFLTAGTVLSPQVMKRYGDDPSVIVVDEAVGMWITLLVFLIAGRAELSGFYIIICFLLFRAFDIVKIQPSKYFDEMKSATGVMLDDAVAGIYAGICAVMISYTGLNPF